jgi:hypothetical protein
MSDVSAAGAIADTTGLAAQVAAEDAASYEAAVASSKQDPANKPEPSGEQVDGKGKGQVPGKDVQPGPEEEEQEQEKPEGPEDKGKKEDPTPEPPKAATLKIGKREFASPEEAVKEATRIMGHNAELSGDLRVKEAEIANLRATSSQLEAQLAEAVRFNQEWQAWHKSQSENGNVPAPTVREQPIEEVVTKVVAKLRDAERETQTQSAMKAEFDKIQTASNYPQVAETVYAIADKVNPITGRYFTPLEAYQFACRHLGIADEIAAQSTAMAQKPAASTPPSPATNPAVKQGAARPSASGRRAPAPARIDEVDDVLNNAFPTFHP